MTPMVFATGYKEFEDKILSHLNKNSRRAEYVSVFSATHLDNLPDVCRRLKPKVLVIRENLNDESLDFLSMLRKIKVAMPDLQIIVITKDRKPGDPFLTGLIIYQIYDFVTGDQIYVSDIAKMIRSPRTFQDIEIYVPKVNLEQNSNQFSFEKKTIRSESSQLQNVNTDTPNGNTPITSEPVLKDSDKSSIPEMDDEELDHLIEDACQSEEVTKLNGTEEVRTDAVAAGKEEFSLIDQVEIVIDDTIPEEPEMIPKTQENSQKHEENEEVEEAEKNKNGYTFYTDSELLLQRSLYQSSLKNAITFIDSGIPDDFAKMVTDQITRCQAVQKEIMKRGLDQDKLSVATVEQTETEDPDEPVADNIKCQELTHEKQGENINTEKDPEEKSSTVQADFPVDFPFRIIGFLREFMSQDSIALNVAAILAEKGKKTAFVDVNYPSPYAGFFTEDSEGNNTLTNSSTQPDNLTIYVPMPKEASKTIRDLSNMDYDCIIVDGNSGSVIDVSDVIVLDLSQDRFNIEFFAKKCRELLQNKPVIYLYGHFTNGAGIGLKATPKLFGIRGNVVRLDDSGGFNSQSYFKKTLYTESRSKEEAQEYLSELFRAFSKVKMDSKENKKGSE